MGAAITAVALDGLPEIRAGEDPAGLIAAAMPAGRPAEADVLVVAHKFISKAEGRTRALSQVTVSERARSLAAELDKDPRHVQVVLDETAEVRRAVRGVLIAVTHHGFVCANAGVDASNSADDDTVILLPLDPDDSARRLRAGLRARLGVAPAVLITDSFGRAWRNGQADVAIGCAGLAPLEDWRGRADARGRELQGDVDRRRRRAGRRGRSRQGQGRHAAGGADQRRGTPRHRRGRPRSPSTAPRSRVGPVPLTVAPGDDRRPAALNQLVHLWRWATACSPPMTPSGAPQTRWAS